MELGEYDSNCSSFLCLYHFSSYKMNFTISEIQITIKKDDLVMIASDLAQLDFDDRKQCSDDFISQVESICGVVIPRQMY